MRLLLVLSVALAARCASPWAFAQEVKVRVEGEGWLRFSRNGRMLYAKEATLTVIGGHLAERGGATVWPRLALSGPFTVQADGQVTSGGAVAGTLSLAVFQNPPTGTGLVAASERPRVVAAGSEAGRIVLASGQAQVTVHREDVEPVAVETKRPQVAPPTEEALRAGAVQIVLNDLTEVTGETFTLGEIATVTAKADIAERLTAIDLGETPPIGIERIVERSRILARLKQAGLTSLEKVAVIGSMRAKVVRRAQRVTHQDFVAAALKAAADKAPGSFESKTPGPDMVLPMGEVQLVAESTTVANGRANVTVAAYVDGRRVNSRTVRLEAAQSAATSLRPGASVDVRVVSGGAAIQTKGKVTRVDAATGEVTVTVAETGAVLVGKLSKEGVVEVRS